MKLPILAVALIAFTAPLPSAAQDSPNGLRNPDSEFVDTTERGAWHAVIERTERGHRIGNPQAKTELIEFISYTCAHCADFAREGEGTLDLALLEPGLLTLEVRPVIRNALDLTVSLLVQCGDPAGFKQRHRLFLLSHDRWLSEAQRAPRTQQASWERGDAAARLSAARALDLDDMLVERGMSMIDVNACLSDETAARTLIGNGLADVADFAVPGTPSFALEGELLKDVHGWDALYGVLSDYFRPETIRARRQDADTP
ncbi:MAG: thioredoxin domain-containing protein [Erythrobacter sp.]